MEKFEVGNIVLVLFPFSDLRGQKLRPALILAKAEFDNLILCQITSKPYTSRLAIKLTKTDFARGGLSITSYIRPDKLFTADKSIIYKTAGTLTVKKKLFILSKIRKIFTQ